MAGSTSRRWPHGALFTAAAILSWCCPMAYPQDADAVASVVVVEAGQARARVVLPAGAGSSLREAAATLVEGIRRRCGVGLEVVTEPAPAAPGLVALHCGRTSAAAAADLGLERLDPDGFVIAVPDRHSILLVGGSDAGTEYAVYDFLERYAGRRWLFPGALGEHAPQSPELRVPVAMVRSEPAFHHRLFSGLGKTEEGERRGEQALWARRNRMRGRVQFHHNLWRLFLPEQLTAAHPEVYPVLEDKRFLPAPAPGKTTAQDVRAQVSWQPCFTAPGGAELAADIIRDYLGQHPEATSYSLGINDCNRYCTCPSCMALDDGRVNSIGVRDVSASYYTWCNAIAGSLAKDHPDTWLGLLAYNGAYSPPEDLRLAPRLVPFITYDRMKWAEPELARLGKAHTEAWAAKASVLGWYDYIYGGQFYLMPRVYPRQMADYLRYGYAQGVRHYYAEAYPAADWHEGPKLYVALKLLWDPAQDVEAILRDWYESAVGPAAAPALARYFDFWEEFWTRRVPATHWFRNNGNRQYLDFGSSGYAEALTVADLDACGAALEEAVRLAPAGPCQDRARYFLAGWQRRQTEIRSLVRLRQPERVTVVRNLLANAFDQGLDGWTHWQRDYSKAAFAHDPATGRGAPGALLVDAAGSQGTPLCFTRAVPIERGKTHRVSAWWRGAGIDDSATISIQVKWKDATGAWVSLATMASYDGAPFSTDWKRLDVHYETGTDGLWERADTAMFLLTVEQTAAGRVWFDDVSLDEVDIP